MEIQGLLKDLEHIHKTAAAAAAQLSYEVMSNFLPCILTSNGKTKICEAFREAVTHDDCDYCLK